MRQVHHIHMLPMLNMARIGLLDVILTLKQVNGATLHVFCMYYVE